MGVIVSAVLGMLFYLALIVFPIGGYVLNIYKLATHVGEFAMMEIVRIVGLFIPPVGVVMGWIG